MRINAYLSLAAVASRRGADRLIKADKVTINGRPAQLNSEVNDTDVVRVEGKTIQPEKIRYILLNKPVGYVSTLRDPEGRPKVSDLVNLPERLKPVGRLDYNTSGLLLLSNDGHLAHKLMHPSHELNKTYQVKVRGKITDEILNLLSNGVELSDGRSAPATVRQMDSSTISLTIHEGRNRQVRRMMEVVGLKLIKLERTAYGPLTLNGIKPGAWRELSKEELGELNRIASAKIKTNGSKKKTSQTQT